MSDIEVVRYCPELKEQIIAFWDRPRSYFEWKYEQNPYFREPMLFVAVDAEGRVVGTRGFCGSRWHTPEEGVVIPCAEDFAIADQHRNTGLATAIMRTALEDLEHRGYRYVMSASAGEITVLQSLAMGWKSIGGMEPVAHLARCAPVARVSRAVRSTLRRGRSTPFERLDPPAVNLPPPRAGRSSSTRRRVRWQWPSSPTVSHSPVGSGTCETLPTSNGASGTRVRSTGSCGTSSTAAPTATS